jgi:hypothetical protein
LGRTKTSYPSISLDEISGWGIGDDVEEAEDMEQTEAGWCHATSHATMPIHMMASPNMTCTNSMCSLTPYFRLPIDGSSTRGELISESELSSDVKKALDERVETIWDQLSCRNGDRTLGGPKNDESMCFNNPEPASPTLYCRKISTKRWLLSYRWYCFVDQLLEMNQVSTMLT